MSRDDDRSRGRVLIVEDEDYVRRSLADLLGSRRFDVEEASSTEQALLEIGRSPIDAVLTDLRMAGAGGLVLVREIAKRHPEIPTIVLTGHGTIASAVECVRAGAADYLLKPADPDVLELTLERVLSARALRREVGYLRRGAEDDRSEAIGESPAWRQVVQRVEAAAPTDATVLILGESGTGKELLARMIHRSSGRAERAFVRVNCAAVPFDMWESEFFGHRRGAFTGAATDREGRFLLAHRGTLFMDEIGTMPLASQAKILRVLEYGEFERLGDDRPTRVDVRIVAATNSDLEQEVEAGRFRRDLFYRLNVVRIEVPPLRERREDIPALVSRFVRDLSAQIGRDVPEVPGEVLDGLAAYDWPGNVRELKNVIERALILDRSDTLGPVELPELVPAAGSPAVGPDDELNLRASVARREREVILEAIRRSGGVRKEAARLLGIDPRNLPYYLHKHRIDAD